jgi:hypothetical protein
MILLLLLLMTSIADACCCCWFLSKERKPQPVYITNLEQLAQTLSNVQKELVERKAQELHNATHAPFAMPRNVTPYMYAPPTPSPSPTHQEMKFEENHFPKGE